MNIRDVSRSILNDILQIRYFTTFLLLISVQLIYLTLSPFHQLLHLLPQCFPSTVLTQEISSVTGLVTRGALGTIGCLVGALTIERWVTVCLQEEESVALIVLTH